MDRLTCLTVTAFLMASALGRGQGQVFEAPRNICEVLQVESAQVQDLVLPPANRRAFTMRLSLDGIERVLHLEPYEIRSRDFHLLVDDGNDIREVPAPPPVTYRGAILGEPGSAVAATVIDGQVRAELHSGGKSWAVQPIGDAAPGLLPTTHVVYRRSDLLALPFACATVGGPVEPEPEAPGTSNATSLRIAELAIDADEPFYRARGSSVVAVQNDITGILNAMDVIYNRDVGIEHQVTTILVRTAPTYSTNNPSRLLDQFADRWIAHHQNIRRDVAHLFTGRGTAITVGITFIRSICNNESGYGVSFSLFDQNLTARVGLTAHEMGHAWGAIHCDGQPSCSIMCSVVSGCSSNLSSFGPDARARISAFRDSRSCLVDPQPTQAPVLTDITPGMVTSFDPDEVTITGSLLDTVTAVSVAGVPIGFTPVDDSTLRFTPPGSLGISTQQVTMTNAAGSSSIGLEVTGNHPGVLEAPPLVLRGVPAAYRVHTDQGWQALLVVSTSQVPSVLPGISLDIGNGFTDLIAIPVFADASGTAEIYLTFPSFIVPIATVWQAVTFDPNSITLPVETSNVTTVLVF